MSAYSVQGSLLKTQNKTQNSYFERTCTFEEAKHCIWGKGWLNSWPSRTQDSCLEYRRLARQGIFLYKASSSPHLPKEAQWVTLRGRSPSSCMVKVPSVPASPHAWPQFFFSNVTRSLMFPSCFICQSQLGKPGGERSQSVQPKKLSKPRSPHDASLFSQGISACWGLASGRKGSGHACSRSAPSTREPGSTLSMQIFTVRPL